MISFLTEAFIPLIMAILTGYTTFYFTKRSQNKQLEEQKKQIDGMRKIIETYSIQLEPSIILNSKMKIFTNRDKMLEAIRTMYKNANAGEIIWGQSVSGNIIGNVTTEVINAAKNGVKFEMIFSRETCDKEEINLKKDFLKLLQLLKVNKLANIYTRRDNNVRIQGISTKKVIIAIPDTDKYVAVLIEDEATVQIFRNWFLSRIKGAEKL